MEGAQLFAFWKRRRLVTNKELAGLLGISESRVDKKLNARAPTQLRLWKSLANIDRLIAVGCPPEDASEKMRGNIFSRRIR